MGLGLSGLRQGPQILPGFVLICLLGPRQVKQKVVGTILIYLSWRAWFHLKMENGPHGRNNYQYMFGQLQCIFFAGLECECLVIKPTLCLSLSEEIFVSMFWACY